MRLTRARNVLNSENDETYQSKYAIAKNRRMKLARKSFLLSLSSGAISRPTDPNALQYRNIFPLYKEALCTILFCIYNEEIFNNKLPQNLIIHWNNRMKKSAGSCCNTWIVSGGDKVRISRVQMSTKVCTCAERTRDTLLHELCHAAAWIIDGVNNGHGDTWRAWTKKAMKIFPELPPVSICHNYVIFTKYSYRCKTCRNTLGRHSKSVNVEHQRCGLCLGEFELLENSENKRTPSAFTKYLKDNYQKIKQRNPDLKHTDVMKILGKEYSAQKAKMKLRKRVCMNRG